MFDPHFHPRLTTLTLDEQIAHIEENIKGFDELVENDPLYRRTPRQYFEEYQETTDRRDGFGALYWSVCSDLGIEPKGKL
jgi:peptidoglycan/xylan/chitin deacetylase (PgdA/CDA1 family)